MNERNLQSVFRSFVRVIFFISCSLLLCFIVYKNACLFVYVLFCFTVPRCFCFLVREYFCIFVLMFFCFIVLLFLCSFVYNSTKRRAVVYNLFHFVTICNQRMGYTCSPTGKKIPTPTNSHPIPPPPTLHFIHNSKHTTLTTPQYTLANNSIPQYPSTPISNPLP